MDGFAPALVDSFGYGRPGRLGGLLQYLELDLGEASEGVLRESAVVNVLDPGAPPHRPGSGTLQAAVAALGIRRACP